MDIHIVAYKFYEYSSYIRGYSQATIKRYKHAIRYYTSFAGVTHLEEITNINLRQMFFDGRMQRNWRPATFISYQKSLSVFFEWCISEGYMRTNPIADLETPKLEKHLPVNLNKQDAYRLLEAVYNYPFPDIFIRYRNHAIFATLMLAGLRKQEVLHLRYTDVDLLNMTLFIHEGKGKKDRIIPICHALATSLNRYVFERMHQKITCPEFFASGKGNRGISDTTLKRLVDTMRSSSEIPFSLHKLRHTFATLMIEGGCDIFSLSKMMGHENIRTTTIYLNASADHLRSQMYKHPLNT